MTIHSTSYTFEICPICNELNNTPVYGELVPRDLKMDASGGTP